MSQLIVIIIAVIALAGGGYIYMRIRKIGSTFKVHESLKTEIEDMRKKVEIELERTKKILKNDENTKLYNTWVDDHNILISLKAEFDVLFDELVDAKKFTRYNEYMSINTELETLSDEFKEKYDNLYKRIHKFTEFEQSNNTISVQLISRIREEQNRYDSNLGHLKIYDTSFNEEVEKAKLILSEFENLEREGQYIQARSVLKQCNEIIQEVEHVNKLISVFQTNFIAIRSNIKNLEKSKEEIEKLGYLIDIPEFDEMILGFNEKLDECVEKTAIFTFGTHIEQEVSNDIIKELSTLDDEIKLMIPKIAKCFDQINEVTAIRKLNDDAIEVLATLAAGALEEKDVIAKFYDIEQLSEVQTLDAEIDRLKKFVNDYKKLEVLIIEATEPYTILLERLEQSQKYLSRMTAKFKDTIKLLESVRNDELAAQDATIEYRRALINIDLYLRKYNHLNSMSSPLASQYREANSKYKQLETELHSEPLNIDNVNRLSESIAKILSDILDDKLVKDIKQRQGCQYILHYLAKFTYDDEVERSYRRFEMLFSTRQYQLFLKEASSYLQTGDKRGNVIYKELVSHVQVDDYKDFV